MIELLLVDDHAVVREGYRRLIERRTDLHVAAEADDAEAALQHLRSTPIDLVVLDLSLPGMGGIELTRRILQRHPTMRILAFSMHRDPLFAAQALKAGALGYVTKSSTPQTLIDAIYQVNQGQKTISPDIAPDIAISLLAGETSLADQLSPREFEILTHLATGKTAEDIATILNLSQKTVHNIHYQIKAKLGVRSDFELARLAAQHRLGE